jgi:epoxyqueuosine reductase
MNSSDIINFLRNQDIELIGITPIKPLLTDERYIKIASTLCPNAKNVIVFATIFPQSVLDACPENSRSARFTLHNLYAEGGNISIKLSRFLERNGYRGVIIPAYLPVEMSYETFGLKGDLNLKHAAVEAGLGSRGINDLLITEKFGPRVRLFGVITDADLEPTPKDKKEICSKCNACIDSCPSGAISEAGCDPKLCSPYAMKNGLPSILNFFKELESEESIQKIMKKLRGLQFWEYWQALSQGSFYECFNCLKSCPIGKINFKAK